MTMSIILENPSIYKNFVEAVFKIRIYKDAEMLKTEAKSEENALHESLFIKHTIEAIKGKIIGK